MHKQKEITILEIYERLIQMEAKFDASQDINTRSKKHFLALMFLILFSILADIVIHAVLFYWGTT